MQKSIKHPEVIMILAMTENGLVGRGNELPWKSSLDFKWFKVQTMGWPVLFGRNTANGMPVFPLKNRPCGIISTKIQNPYAVGNNGISPVFPSLLSAYEMFKNFDKIFIAGGPALYSSAMDMNIKLPVEKDGPLIEKPFVDTIVKTVFPDGYADGDKYLDKRTMELMSQSHFRLLHDEKYIIYEREDDTFLYDSITHPVLQDTGDCTKIVAKNPIELFYDARASDTRFPKIDFQIWNRIKENPGK